MCVTAHRCSGHGLRDGRGNIVARSQGPPAEDAFVGEHGPTVASEFGITLLKLFPFRRKIVPMPDRLGVAPARGLPAPRHLIPGRPGRGSLADLYPGRSAPGGGAAAGTVRILSGHVGYSGLETVPGVAGEIVEDHQL